jgi:hypothetical protein
MGWGVVLMLFMASANAGEPKRCYSEQDLMDARCEVACAREGYSSGYHSNGKCLCLDDYSTDKIIKKNLKLPKKIEKPEHYY